MNDVSSAFFLLQTLYGLNPVGYAWNSSPMTSAYLAVATVIRASA
jgi:hypothetical protein